MRIAGFILFMFTAFTASAQRAATFQQAATNGLTVQQLDRTYSNALDADTAKAVFKGEGAKQFYKAYVTMMYDVSAYLKAHYFSWGKPTRVVHRIYFQPDGAIDHYLVNLAPANMGSVKEQQLLALLNSFAKEYKFKLPAGRRFAQCGPAVYEDIN